MNVNPEITLDENHVYRVDGKRVPSVSAILQSTGIIDTTWFTPHGAHRGTTAHTITQYSDENDLDESSVDDSLKGYLEAWKRYRADSGFVPSMIEKKLYSRLGFCGTIDRLGTDRSGRSVLLDIKTGQPMWWHPAQICGGYKILVEEAIPGAAIKVIMVHLKHTGKYAIEPYQWTDISKGRELFLNALSIVSERINNKCFWSE